MTNLLIDKLKRSANGRVVNVSSIVHIVGEINFSDINLNEKYDRYSAHANSKLAVVLFSRELASRLSNTKIRTYCLHPGLVRTEIWRHMEGLIRIGIELSNIFIAMDTEMGAQTTLYCALDAAVGKETGHYYKYDIRTIGNHEGNPRGTIE